MPNNRDALRSLPAPVVQTLKDLGAGISVARRRRRQTQQELAERMNVNVRTLRSLEAGDPGVGLGVFACALWALGLLRKLDELSSPTADMLGLSRSVEELPRRVRRPSPRF
jgi:transcriptional regulator with XRE-family HTH domain